jgi:hypothetical protein
VREYQLNLRLSGAELAIIDEHRGSLKRQHYLRHLIRAAAGLAVYEGLPNHDEALRLLREAALSGSITARVAYERALRAIPQESGPMSDELERVIGG